MAVLLQSAGLPGGYGWALFETLLALVGVCVLAWVVLHWAARQGFGTGGGGGRMRVVDRVALDARRGLALVEVGERMFLVGTGDGAAPTMLAEIDPAAVPAPKVAARGTLPA
ncbi:MAG: flagellar biosynthetic protein FliO [Polyangiales bacterium]